MGIRRPVSRYSNVDYTVGAREQAAREGAMLDAPPVRLPVLRRAERLDAHGTWQYRHITTDGTGRMSPVIGKM